jgi:predicted porin
MSSGKALSQSATQGAASGGSFNATNNSSLIGFKGTEDLGNGLKGLFQVESNINITANTAGTNNAATYSGTSNSFSSLRDSFVGASSKYGTVMGGYLSTPYRSALNSFDVMPGATGVGRIENLMGNVRLNNQNQNSATVGQGGIQASASIRTTAVAYALPTMYGFNGSLAYTGNNNGSTSSGRNQGAFAESFTSVVQAAAQQAISANLGWEGYGIGIKGAYQQAKVNYNDTNLQGYTSYLVGAQYTGVPGLKASAVYGRNTVGINAVSADSGAAKGSNNQFYLGASYRFGNNEPRLSWATTSNTNGVASQDGGRQITANWGYYLSKRTQVYGLVSAINNNANGIWNMAGTGSAIAPTGGQNLLTYGAGMRTNF